MDHEAWRCKHIDDEVLCPGDGCPVSYGCARDKGWKPGDPVPLECTGVRALENMVSHKNYDPLHIALFRLVAVAALELHLTEAQIARVIDSHRITVRRMIDDGTESIVKRPPTGQWGAGLAKRIRRDA